MVKQDYRNAILFASLSIHEGSPVHVDRLGNRISKTSSHRFYLPSFNLVRQTHRIGCRSLAVLSSSREDAATILLFESCLSNALINNETDRSHIVCCKSEDFAAAIECSL